MNKLILMNIALLAIVASNFSFGMMTTKETPIDSEKHLTNAIASVLQLPELMHHIQTYAGPFFAKPLPFVMRATCHAMRNAVKISKLEEVKPFLTGEKYLLEMCHENDFLPDETYHRTDRHKYYHVSAILAKEKKAHKKDITEHNNAVKRAAYLAVIWQDMAALDCMLEKNLPIPNSLTHTYLFYKDLVVYAIDRSCYKSFEYLIQKNPCNLNNYYGKVENPILMFVGPIAKDVKAACLSKEEEERLLAFCQKNGCLTLQQIKEKPSAENKAQKKSENTPCIVS